MKDTIIEKLRDMKFRGVSLPTIAEGNLPATYVNFPEVRIPKNKFNQFRDWYLLAQVFICAVFNKADVTQWEIEETLYRLATGEIKINIVKADYEKEKENMHH